MKMHRFTTKIYLFAMNTLREVQTTQFEYTA